MDFRILGPLEVVVAGEAVPLGGAKPRAVLIALLLHPGRYVAADRLIAEHLAGTGAGEIAWARRYLWLYMPGIALALGYLAAFAVPGILYLIRLCVAPIRAGGLGTAAAWAGLAALVIAVVPATLALLGAARSGLRVLRTAMTRRRVRRSPGTQL
ncbi:hypothetical protein AB0M46_08380 [Dactylosporangium sp. NPDC051485]|uniref:AfsR/SARP family transcriptional regulator n=1 Tax=Dactylosporangium sp. NPDC051485 TaxID=3154846 RepID=UPI00341666CC